MRKIRTLPTTTSRAKAAAGVVKAALAAGADKVVRAALAVVVVKAAGAAGVAKAGEAATVATAAREVGPARAARAVPAAHPVPAEPLANPANQGNQGNLDNRVALAETSCRARHAPPKSIITCRPGAAHTRLIRDRFRRLVTAPTSSPAVSPTDGVAPCA